MGDNEVIFLNYIIDIFSKAIFLNHEYLAFMFYFAITALLLTTGYYLLYLNLNYRKFRILLRQTYKNYEAIDQRIYIINEEMKKNNFGLLNRIWKRYFNEYSNGKNETAPDPLYYFSDEELVVKAGRRKLVEIIPAAFVSLGLLGTFLGIVAGVSDLNTNADSETLLSGVDTLLGGMKLAFESSIIGILLSLFYQFFDRIYLLNVLQNNCDYVMEELDQTIPIETETSLLDKVAKSQEAQMNDFKTFLTNEVLPAITSGISESISTALASQLERSNEILNHVSTHTLDAQSDSLNEMANYFMNSLNELTGNQMNELKLVLEKTIEWQESVHYELSGLVQELFYVSQEQTSMAEKTMDLTEKLNVYTAKLTEYQQKLTDTSNKFESIQGTLGNLFEEIANERQHLAQLKAQYSNTLTTSVEELSKLWQENYSYMNASQTQLESLNENLSDSMENFAEHMHRGVQNTFEQFDAELKKAVDYLATGVSNMGEFVVEIEESIGNVENQLRNFNANLLEFNASIKNKVITHE